MSSDGAFGHSLGRMLDEVERRRREAARFAQVVELSICQTDVPNDQSTAASPSATEGRGMREIAGSPPASFLEDFARNFVETYKPQRAPVRILGHGPAHRRRAGNGTEYAGGERTLRDGSMRRHQHQQQHQRPHPHSPPEADASEDSGLCRIDRGARARLWSRYSLSHKTRSGTDEARILALVQQAERTVAEDARNPCWVADEWVRWADFVGAALGDVDAAEVQQRLEWVSALGSEARHRPQFNEKRTPGGKILRTCTALGVELHAYPDGNVKRVARVEHRGRACTATTLFFSNGDWHCTVGATADSYYYYSSERVWQHQHSGGTETHYADGSVERDDAR
ncbi:hypothetical protein GGI07_004742 [Coemansia sp. Benny D115]|nr:hypothetical protein GGI07_004742 [Coemansia sp. Benny D115]